MSAYFGTLTQRSVHPASALRELPTVSPRELHRSLSHRPAVLSNQHLSWDLMSAHFGTLTQRSVPPASALRETTSNFVSANHSTLRIAQFEGAFDENSFSFSTIFSPSRSLLNGVGEKSLNDRPEGRTRLTE